MAGQGRKDYVGGATEEGTTDIEDKGTERKRVWLGKRVEIVIERKKQR